MVKCGIQCVDKDISVQYLKKIGLSNSPRTSPNSLVWNIQMGRIKIWSFWFGWIGLALLWNIPHQYFLNEKMDIEDCIL